MSKGKAIPIDYQEGNTKHSASMFFEKLTAMQRERIKTVNIDMSRSYISAIKTYLPQAKIIIDKFHLLGELNRNIGITKRQMFRQIDRKESQTRGNFNYKVIKNAEFHLLNQAEKNAVGWAIIKRPHNLTYYQSMVLEKLERWNTPLYRAYLLKEQFYALLMPQPKQTAERNLRLWMTVALQTKISPLRYFCKTLETHMPYILNYFEYGRTSAAIEGVNNKIKVIKRMAYGYKNLDYFFRKIRSKFYPLPMFHSLFTYT
jgi:transposase